MILMRRIRAIQTEKRYRQSRGIPRTGVFTLNKDSIG
jgi:hypothetical protein